ncbi:helix-turn-helix domain-containing protein, partial [Rhodococcus erythropolis]
AEHSLSVSGQNTDYETVPASATSSPRVSEGARVRLAPRRDARSSRWSATLCPQALLTAALDVGTIRAQQHVPLPTVLHSFRIDLRTLWDALIAEGRYLDLAARTDFLELLSVIVWETVETSTEEMVRGYQVAQGGLEEIRAEAFDQLLIDGAANHVAVDNAAQILGLPVSGTFLCPVGDFGVPQPELIGGCAHRLSSSGIAHHFGWYGHELRAIVHRPNTRTNLIDYLVALEDHVCTVVDAEGLAHVPGAIRLARTTVEGRVTPGVRHVRETWLHTIAAGNAEVADAVHKAVFGPLQMLSEYERTALLETVGDLVAYGGTIANIAERTHRHRNTVRRRLRDFTTLTGLDVTSTSDLAVTALALTVEQRRSHSG